MNSSSSPITWKLERGCRTVKELSQFKLLLWKIFSLDRLYTLILCLLFWWLILLKDLRFASLRVYNSGETLQGLMRHLSFPQRLSACSPIASLCRISLRARWCSEMGVQGQSVRYSQYRLCWHPVQSAGRKRLWFKYQRAEEQKGRRRC